MLDVHWVLQLSALLLCSTFIGDRNRNHALDPRPEQFNSHTVLNEHLRLLRIADLSIFLVPYASKIQSYFTRIGMSAGNFCHWIITATHIKVSFETRTLIVKNTYIKTATEVVSVDRFRCCLTITNVVISILILLVAITAYFGILLDSSTLLSVANNSTLVFSAGCLLTWAWTLIRLYKDIKQSEKLLPKKRILILHGSLLTRYLLISVLSQILYYESYQTEL